MQVTIQADRLRGIPPGRRIVELVECGRKWVRVRLPGHVNCKRITRRQFDRVIIREEGA